MLVWVPLPPVASALDGIDGITVEVVDPDAIDAEGGELPASAAKVGFYVPPLFPRPPAIAALAAMPNLRVVQTLTAGVDLLLPHRPAGVVLCNARGLHDVSTAEWVVTVMLATTRKIAFFLGESNAGRWSPAFASLARGPDRPDRRPRLDRPRRSSAGWPGSKSTSFGWPERSGPECARPPNCRRCCRRPMWWYCSLR